MIELVIDSLITQAAIASFILTTEINVLQTEIDEMLSFPGKKNFFFRNQTYFEF